MAASIDEQILRATKEIIVKFIEVGRVSPTSFDESFRTVYQTIHDSVKQNQKKTPKHKGLLQFSGLPPSLFHSAY